MTCIRWAALAVLVAFGAGGAARADDPAPEAPGRGESILERGLGALRLRMEAKLKEAALLERLGKLDEALAATREVERLYRDTIADLERLVKAAQKPGWVILPSPRFVPPPPPISAPLPEELRPPPRGGPSAPQASNAATAVQDGLRWLAAHQSEDGGWEAAGFHTWCDGKRNTGEKPDGEGKAMYDAGVTGLALCAFLGAGYTNRGDHEFAKVVRKGLAYLKNVQDPEGCFGPRSTQHFIYNHGMAALAMVEAYGMTESPIFQGSAQKALDFIALARNPYFVWRYGVKPGDNDTSVTGWMGMTLHSARLINEAAVAQGRPAPLVLDEEAFDGIRAWLDKMTDPDYGRVGYLMRGTGPARPQELVDRFPAEKSEAMTAVGLLLRLLAGEKPRQSALLEKGADLCGRLLPTWEPSDGSIDMIYWYYGTLAMFRMGGERWSGWDRALTRAVVHHQRRDGTYCSFKGSWDPLDPWGPDGGRVYSTALMTLCCQVSARYDRVVGTR